MGTACKDTSNWTESENRTYLKTSNRKTVLPLGMVKKKNVINVKKKKTYAQG